MSPFYIGPRYRVGNRIKTYDELISHQVVGILEDDGSITPVKARVLMRYRLMDYMKVKDRIYTVQQMY